MTSEVCKCGKSMKKGYSEVAHFYGPSYALMLLPYPAITTYWSCECGYRLVKHSGPYVDNEIIPAEEWNKVKKGKNK